MDKIKKWIKTLHVEPTPFMEYPVMYNLNSNSKTQQKRKLREQGRKLIMESSLPEEEKLILATRLTNLMLSIGHL